MKGKTIHRIRLRPRDWRALDYAVTVTDRWTEKGKVLIDCLNPDWNAINKAFEVLWVANSDSGESEFRGYFVREENVEKILDAFENSPSAARLVGERLASAYASRNELPRGLRRLSYLLLSGDKVFPRKKAVKPSLHHRDFLLAALADYLNTEMKLPLGSNEATLEEVGSRPVTASAVVAAAMNACGVHIDIKLATRIVYRDIASIRASGPMEHVTQPLLAAWSGQSWETSLPSQDQARKVNLLAEAALWLRSRL